MALGTAVLGYCLMQFDNGTASKAASWLSVGATMMCIAGYAMMLQAPVVWILCSEIQPLKCRDFGIYLTTANWVSNAIGASYSRP